LLPEKLKKYQDSNTVVLTYLEAACPLVTKLQKRLHSFRYYTLKKINLSTEFAIGAVSLASTIVDEQPDIPKEYIETNMRELLRQKIQTL
jgi:hypothetical protein